MPAAEPVKVTPLAYESLGVRSMCTLFETRDVRILADAGVALGPRFRLMPHPLEYRAMRQARERIESAARQSRVTTISHYHNDHHTPGLDDPVWLGSTKQNSELIYRGKTVLVKDYRTNINTAQRRRGWLFKQGAERVAKSFEVADGQTFTYGRTTLQFTRPVPHGETGNELGWIIPFTIESKGEKVFYAPDVQGPVEEQTMKLILETEPEILILGGPPTYLRGFKVGEEFFEKALANMGKLAAKIPVLVVDHHLLRDKDWRTFIEPVVAKAESAGNKLMAASQLIGEDARPLENDRRRLYEEQKPTKSFLDWAKMPKEKQKTAPPLE